MKVSIPESISKNISIQFLLFAFIISFVLKVNNITIGSPFVTIDDNTNFNGGFLVWFGQVPPQRMYLESWVTGIVCLVTFIAKSLAAGQGLEVLKVNLVADAFRDYYGMPDPYVLSYRWVMLAFDMLTAWFVYQVAKQVLRERWQGMAAVMAAVMYLFSYNTVWSDVVARPDTLTAFFAMAGLYFYYRSDFGEKIQSYWISSALLGCAAGMKLHGAFFAIFIVFDLLRVHGFFRGLVRALPLVIISITFFALSAGIPLFDPLKYVKLRMLNYKDDLSPWITWGDHFITLFRGTGWLTIPLIFAAALGIVKNSTQAHDHKGRSVILLSICWLLLFAAIRALRAYWMLPALPLFYIAAVYALGTVRGSRLAGAVAAVVIALMALQTFHQFWEFRGTDYNGLRRWVVENVQANEAIYIYGYEALYLPKSTQCIARMRAGLEKTLQRGLDQDVPFTVRHVKNWEEKSELVLFDMLNFRYDGGYTYYGFYSAPLEVFEDIITLDEMRYIMIQQHFDMSLAPGLAQYLEAHCTFIAHRTGAGGGGRGLEYRIYKRKPVSA